MPRKQRVAKPLRARVCEEWPDDPRAVKELLQRAQWGGILSGLAPLTPAERRAWRRYQQAQPTWVPRRTLSYSWACVDSIHGSGPWDARAFDAALDKDKAAIDAVCYDHPEQRPRLTVWLAAMEMLGADRAADPRAGGAYIQRLLALGYSSFNDKDHDD